MFTAEQLDSFDRPLTEQEIIELYGIASTDHRFRGYPSGGWRGDLCRYCWQYEIQHTIQRAQEDIAYDISTFYADLKQVFDGTWPLRCI